MENTRVDSANDFSWDRTIQKVIELVLEGAKDARESAAYSGSFGDGGAHLIETQVEFFKYGMEKKIPPQWKKHLDTLDPEYQEYKRLKAKFE